MNNENTERDLLPIVLDVVVRLGVIVVLLVWALNILKPFLLPLIWGVILAVASSPVYEVIVTKFKGRRRLAAVLQSFLMLALIVLPCWYLAESVLIGASAVKERWLDGQILIPPPTENVKEWPVIGERFYKIWHTASEDLGESLSPFLPQIRTLVTMFLSGVAGLGFAFLEFILAIIICGALLSSSEFWTRSAEALSLRLASRRGLELLKDAKVTVQNVARGILGVALIQAILAGIGMAVAGIPGAGLWALICLFFAVIQVGVTPVMLIASIYLFSKVGGMTAILFFIWAVFVSAMDNILKPIILGKGAPVPMLVIFMGAIGGVITSGFLGLFVGAVIVSLAYKLFVEWLRVKED